MDTEDHQQIESFVNELAEKSRQAIESFNYSKFKKCLVEVDELQSVIGDAFAVTKAGMLIDAGTEWNDEKLLYEGLQCAGESYGSLSDSGNRFILAYNAFNAAIALYDFAEEGEVNLKDVSRQECERWLGLARLNRVGAPIDMVVLYFVNSAGYYQRQHRWLEAADAAEKALEIDPAHPMAAGKLAAILDSWLRSVWSLNTLTYTDVFLVLLRAHQLLSLAINQSEVVREIAYSGAEGAHISHRSRIEDWLKQRNLTIDLIEENVRQARALHPKIEQGDIAHELLRHRLFATYYPELLNCPTRLTDKLLPWKSTDATKTLADDLSASHNEWPLYLQAAYEDFIIAREIFLSSKRGFSEPTTYIIPSTRCDTGPNYHQSEIAYLKTVIRVAVDGFDKLSGYVNETWELNIERQDFRKLGRYFHNSERLDFIDDNPGYYAFKELCLSMMSRWSGQTQTSPLSGLKKMGFSLNDYRNAITHRVLQVVEDAPLEPSSECLTKNELYELALETLQKLRSAIVYLNLGVAHERSKNK